MSKSIVLIISSVMCVYTYAKSANLYIYCGEIKRKQKHPIYCQIIKNKKSISKDYAMELSNLIYSVSRKHNIDSRLFTAILAQESMYDNKAKGCVKGLDEYFLESRVCNDFGIVQINNKTADRLNIDLYKVMDDLEYSLEAGATVLKGFQKQFGDDPDFFVRYNCGSRGTTKRATCQKYKKQVTRFL